MRHINPNPSHAYAFNPARPDFSGGLVAERIIGRPEFHSGSIASSLPSSRATASRNSYVRLGGRDFLSRHSSDDRLTQLEVAPTARL